MWFPKELWYTAVNFSDARKAEKVCSKWKSFWFFTDGFIEGF